MWCNNGGCVGWGDRPCCLVPASAQFEPRPFAEFVGELGEKVEVILTEQGAQDIAVTRHVAPANYFVGQPRESVGSMLSVVFTLNSKGYVASVIGQYTRHRNKLMSPLARLTVKVERDHTKDGPNRIRPGARERTRPKVQKWAEDSPIRKLGLALSAALDLLTAGLCAPDLIPPFQYIRECQRLERDHRRERELWGPNPNRCKPFPPPTPPPPPPAEYNPWI